MTKANLETYKEQLVMRVFARGTPRQHRALVPSDLDIALLNAQIAQQEQELERLEAQAAPRHVLELLDKRSAGDKLDPVETGTVLNYEQGRIAETEAWGAALFRTRKRLQEALKQLEDSETNTGLDLEVREFVLRDFSYRQRLDAENVHSTLNAQTGQRQVLVNDRNLALLNQCLVHEERDGQIVNYEDAAELPAKITQVLIDRMWARAEMSPELASHFRRGS